jgi:hypothetical protein
MDKWRELGFWFRSIFHPNPQTMRNVTIKNSSGGSRGSSLPPPFSQEIYKNNVKLKICNPKWI